MTKIKKNTKLNIIDALNKAPNTIINSCITNLYSTAQQSEDLNQLLFTIRPPPPQVLFMGWFLVSFSVLNQSELLKQELFFLI